MTPPRSLIAWAKSVDWFDVLNQDDRNELAEITANLPPDAVIVSREPTDEMVRAAVSAWYGSPPDWNYDNAIMHHMRVTIRAALGNEAAHNDVNRDGPKQDVRGDVPAPMEPQIPRPDHQQER